MVSMQEDEVCENHESQLLNVAAGNGVAIACGDVPQVKNSMLFHFMELSKEEHVLHMIYAWKKKIIIRRWHYFEWIVRRRRKLI